MLSTLSARRVLSIDAFRGITILIMIFVNELAGVKYIPVWMKHVSADADAMTFVDVVFPAFLFIVGMSIPFALATRIAKGDSTLQRQKHIIVRTIGLLVLGIFMVNAEGGYNQQAMGVSIYLWSLLFYCCVILIWNVYSFQNKTIPMLLRVLGIAGLITLAFVYKGGEDGSEHLTPQWWGILGLIGWAYLMACIIYQLSQANMIALAVAIIFCICYYCIGQSKVMLASPLLIIFSQGGHAVHTAIVLCGVVLTLIFFDEKLKRTTQRRFIDTLIFIGTLLISGYLLRPYYQISKIHATPTWCLYSAAICCFIFSALYWIIDLKKINRWTAFFKPAAANPLLTYIIPTIVYAIIYYFAISLPAILHQGSIGILYSVAYAIFIMTLVIGLNKINIRLQL